MGYKVKLFTFGQPRIGNSKFISFTNSKLAGNYLRGVFKEDPITTQPSQMFGFAHGGAEIHFYECNPKSFIWYPSN